MVLLVEIFAGITYSLLDNLINEVLKEISYMFHYYRCVSILLIETQVLD